MIGQYKRDLNVVPYRSAWPRLFEQEAARLRQALGDKVLRIEHIGSTSVPGLEAKPIIDIMVAVDSLSHVDALIPVFQSLGYLHRPADTIPERLFFALESTPEHRTHHLSLTELGSGYWKKHLAFRDYLRAHGEAAAEYVALKKQLAKEYARTRILDRDAKTEFVTKVLKLAREEGLLD